MTGHHEVQSFDLRAGLAHGKLPPNWKPFAVIQTPDGWAIIARKWVRDDSETQTTQEAQPST